MALGLRDALEDANLDLVYPATSSLMDSNGQWNQVAPIYRFRHSDENGIVTLHEDLSTVSGLSDVDRAEVVKGLIKYTDDHVIPKLEVVNSSTTVSVFHLDPNQLLRLSSGFKVVLRRPL